MTGLRYSRLPQSLPLDVGAVKDGWNGFAVLHDTASRVGALDIGFAAGAGGLSAAQMTTFGTLDVLFLLGADETKAPDGTFVVYIGTHGDRGAHRADVILPGAAYTEKSGIYVNTEGRVQMANRAAFPPGEAREDWAIIRALSEALGKKLGYDSLRRAAAGAVQGRAASDARRPDRGRQGRRHQDAGGQGRQRREDAVQVVRGGFLSDQPDRARVGGDGGMFPAGVREDADGSGVSVT